MSKVTVPYSMNGQDLFEWLSEIPEEDRRRSKVSLEIFDRTDFLVTAKFYKKEGRIYLIVK